MTAETTGLIDPVIEDERWTATGLRDTAEQAARAALRCAGLDPERHEISLLACSDARIVELNAQFRDRTVATNVLSWPAFPQGIPQPQGREPLFLGDLAMAYETCCREAEDLAIPLAHHLSHLVVHGTLHLLGFDHIRDDEAEEMEQFEAKILATLHISDPYSQQVRQTGADAG